MTTPKDKPAREWKLQYDGDFDSTGIVIDGSGPHIHDDEVRVIEYSAYEKLKKENARLKKEAAEMYRLLNGGG